MTVGQDCDSTVPANYHEMRGLTSKQNSSEESSGDPSVQVHSPSHVAGNEYFVDKKVQHGKVASCKVLFVAKTKFVSLMKRTWQQWHPWLKTPLLTIQGEAQPIVWYM